MYKVDNVASYIIEYENKHKRSINYLRLCRYLHFIQAQFLVFNNQPCFQETIEAWDCGPMINSVRVDYGMFGNGSIFKPQIPSGYISIEDKKTINEMLEYLAPYSNTQLVHIILNQTPWKIANARSYDKRITDVALYDYFKKEDE